MRAGSQRVMIAFLAVVVAIVAHGCGSGASSFPDDAFAIRASSDLGVGTERLLVGVVRPDGTRLGSPDDPVRLLVEPLDGGPQQNVAAAFTWIVPDGVGLYRGIVDFDRAGAWQVTVVPAEGDPLEPVPFNVFEESIAPAVGDPAPSLETPTLATASFAELTTDPDPDDRFYRLSLDEAIASPAPTVVIFSTPAYCQTAACGPMLENVKQIADEYPEVEFVHIEVYTGLTEPDFAPDQAHLAPAAVAWNLPTEPWVFVVGGDGTITARFEGVLDPTELEAVLG